MPSPLVGFFPRNEPLLPPAMRAASKMASATRLLNRATDSDWDYDWDIESIPNPEGTWYRVPGSRRWVHLDYITSWIHRPTEHHWYLVEDTARPLSARPLLPHQIELVRAKLTLRRRIPIKREVLQCRSNRGAPSVPPFLTLCLMWVQYCQR